MLHMNPNAELCGRKCHIRLTMLLISVLVCSMMMSISGCVPPLKVAGKTVSSGEFYDTAIQHYTVHWPELRKQLNETNDYTQYYNAAPIDLKRWKLTDEDGKTWDYKSRGMHNKKQREDRLSRGITVESSWKVKKVTMPTPTQGSVLLTLIANWQNTNSGSSGQTRRNYVSSWEKIDGQWRIVATQRGIRY